MVTDNLCSVLCSTNIIGSNTYVVARVSICNGFNGQSSRACSLRQVDWQVSPVGGGVISPVNTGGGAALTDTFQGDSLSNYCIHGSAGLNDYPWWPCKILKQRSSNSISSIMKLYH